MPSRDRAPGVLVNLGAGRVRRDPGLVPRIRHRLPAGAVRATGSPEEVGPALLTLHDFGIDTLVVIGGDGSVGGTLSALLACWPAAQLPDVVLAPGGTINTIARSLGAAEDPEAMLERILAGAPPRVQTLRPLVAARADGGEPRAGMIFANGAAVRWLHMYYEGARRGTGAAAGVVARIVGSALLGGPLARRLFEPIAGEVSVDGTRLDLHRFTVAAAASVREIGLGFRPFPSAGSAPTRFHFAISDAGAARIAAELPAIRLGRGTGCIRHFPARRVELALDAPQGWTLDADLFDPARHIELEATRPLRFVVP